MYVMDEKGNIYYLFSSTNLIPVGTGKISYTGGSEYREEEER